MEQMWWGVTMLREDIRIGEDTLLSPKLPALPSPPWALMRALPGKYLSAAALCGLARTQHPGAFCLYHAHPPGNRCPNLAVGGRDQQKVGVEEGKEEGLGRGQGPCNALETRAGCAIMPSKPVADRYRFDSSGGIASHNHAGATPPFSPQEEAPSC